MIEKTHKTPKGTLHYWVSDSWDSKKTTLVFLPGSPYNEKLFSHQIEYFQPKYNVLVWNAPGCGQSYPFTFDYSLAKTARWLYSILNKEAINRPVVIGHGDGGYTAQAFSELFPQNIAGFVGIGTGPLEKRYIKGRDLWNSQQKGALFALYPWATLVEQEVKVGASSSAGKQLIREMLEDYEGNQERYALLKTQSLSMFNEIIEADLVFELICPACLICGENDEAEAFKKQTKSWSKKAKIPVTWIKNAGHCCNVDNPDDTNHAIELFIKGQVE